MRHGNGPGRAILPSATNRIPAGPVTFGMDPKKLALLSKVCFVLGFASILGSIAIWFLTGGTEPDTKAHAERFGIFVGLWAPTFFILSNRFGRFAENKA